MKLLPTGGRCSLGLCYFHLVLIGLILSCDRQVSDGELPFDLFKSSIVIELPSSVSSNLSIPFIWNEKNEELLVAYSHSDHSVIVLNLSKRKFLKKISLSTTGPDFVQLVRAFSIYDRNTLLVGGDQYITFITFDGEVTKRLRINEVNSDFSGFDFSKGRLIVNKYSGLQYNAQNETMLMEVYYFSKRQGFARNRVMVSLNLKKLEIEELAVPNELNRKQGN